MRLLSVIFHCFLPKMSGVERCAFLNAYIFLKKSIIFFCSLIGVVHNLCWIFVLYRNLQSSLSSESIRFMLFKTLHLRLRLRLQPNYFFWGLRKRLRRKNFRVVERALTAQLLWLLCPPLSKTIGGNADVDHSQIFGGDAVKLLGGYIPPSPPGFGTPVYPII